MKKETFHRRADCPHLKRSRDDRRRLVDLPAGNQSTTIGFFQEILRGDMLNRHKKGPFRGHLFKPFSWNREIRP